MYISIRSGKDVKTWNKLLDFATNEVTLQLNEDGRVEQRVQTIFSNGKIISSYSYSEECGPTESILDYVQSDECRKKLEDQGYKLYKIEEVII